MTTRHLWFHARQRDVRHSRTDKLLFAYRISGIVIICSEFVHRSTCQINNNKICARLLGWVRVNHQRNAQNKLIIENATGINMPRAEWRISHLNVKNGTRRDPHQTDVRMHTNSSTWTHRNHCADLMHALTSIFIDIQWGSLELNIARCATYLVLFSRHPWPHHSFRKIHSFITARTSHTLVA